MINFRVLLTVIFITTPPVNADENSIEICPEMSVITKTNNVIDGFNQLFVNDVVLPLIDADVDGLGPKTWLLIAGQAYQESASKMHDENWDYYNEKSGKNWWNMQEPVQIINGQPVCPEGMVLVKSGEGGTPGKPETFKMNCSPNSSSPESSARGYLDFAGRHFSAFNEKLHKPNLSRQEFVDALDKSRWASVKDRDAYKKILESNISSVTATVQKMCKTQLPQLKALQKCLQSKGCKSDDESVQTRINEVQKRIKVLQKACAGADVINSNKPVSIPEDVAPEECPKKPEEPVADLPLPNDGPYQYAGGGTHGDPHYFTADGIAYSSQLAGEFWLVNRNNNFAIQARHEPRDGSSTVSSVSALAFALGKYRIGFYGGKNHGVLVNGKGIERKVPFQQITLDDGAIGVWYENDHIKTATIVWSDGSYALVDWLGDWLVLRTSHASRSATINDKGLFGSADGNPENDIAVRNKISAAHPSIDDFVNSWRVNENESLFDYTKEEPYAYFQRLDFPKNEPDLTESELNDAKQQCINAGITNETLVTQCAFDVAVTKDNALIEHYHLAMQHIAQFKIDLHGYELKENAKNSREKSLAVPDKNNAVILTSSDYNRVLLKPGQVLTFTVSITAAQPLTAYPENMECTGDYTDQITGWQWFDENSKPVSKSRPTCADLVTPTNVNPGKYYLVIFSTKESKNSTVSFKLNMNL